MSRVKFLILYTFFSFCVGSRMFYYPEMCNQMRNINDCSFQFSQTNTCYVFEREECENYNFSSWNLKPLHKYVTEVDSEFTVSILPYAVYVYDSQKEHPLSAIDVILTSRNKDIKGFSLEMIQDIPKRNACRMFDFRESVDSVKVPFTFYYDCLHQLVERGWKNVTMVFKAYPLNTELKYLVYIPSKAKENLSSACSWRPLIMVFMGGLPKYNVHVKFSNAPEDLNIEFFNVTLVDSLGFAIGNSRIPSSFESDMISSKFYVVVDGYYSVLVGIISEEESCLLSETNIFYVGNEIKDYSLILFTITAAVMTIFASAIIYFSFRWYIRNATPPSKCTLLFVYSYKRIHHEFLVMYSRYLDSQYGLKVNMIYEKCGNPKVWLEEKYSESDVIAFIISPSLKTLDQGSVEGEHHWVDQLAEAKALIDNSFVGKKRICKVCFPYSRKDHMPKCLERQGPLFMLPRDLNKFLCFVFGCPQKLHILSKLFNQSHHKLLQPNVIENDEEEIKEKLQIIMKTASRDSPVLNLENTKGMSLVNNLEKSKSGGLIGRNDVPLSENLSKKSGDRKLDFSLQETSCNETENDDFMLYCVRKILYSA